MTHTHKAESSPSNEERDFVALVNSARFYDYETHYRVSPSSPSSFRVLVKTWPRYTRPTLIENKRVSGVWSKNIVRRWFNTVNTFELVVNTNISHANTDSCKLISFYYFDLSCLKDLPVYVTSSGNLFVRHVLDPHRCSRCATIQRIKVVFLCIINVWIRQEYNFINIIYIYI